MMLFEESKLPRHGEKWFKNRGIDSKDWRIFLKNPSMDTIVYKKVFQALLLKVNGKTYCLCLRSLSLVRVGLDKCTFIMLE